MEVEKRGTKGGFLQLFDWNVKSRKKLFSNKSESFESSNPEKLNSLAMSRLQQVQDNESDPSLEGSSDYNFESSLSVDEGYGTRPTGVVARLMGLDSLPTSNVSEPSFTPLNGPSSFRDFHSERITNTFQSDHIINYNIMQNNDASFARIPGKLRQQQLQSRPIERFQTEILPPKAAKSIPSNHHRLLSPIKSPGFVLTKNAAYIMEAAAKIIEQSPQSITKGKASFGSSSVPLRIRDLREKMEAAQKASVLPQTSRRPKNPNFIGKSSVDSEKLSSDSFKSKDKSVSLSVQAKANGQRKEGSTSGSNRSFTNQKRDIEVKSGRFDKSQANLRQSVQKRTLTSRKSDVLRQNNQKQNSASDKDKVSLKPSVSNQQAKKTLDKDGSVGPNKTLNKVVLNSVSGTRKTSSVLKGNGMEHLSSKTTNTSKKKKPVNGNIHFDENAVESDVIIGRNERTVKCNVRNERTVKCNVTTDGFVNLDSVERKNSMEVVSFTFTSPIKRSNSGSRSSGQVENTDNFFVDPYNDQPYLKNSTSSSLGLNITGSDALSVLLEQKLKELTCRVDSSHCNLIKAEADSSSGPCGSSLRDSRSTLNVVSAMPMESDKTIQIGLPKDELDSLYELNFSLVGRRLPKAKQKWQELKEMEEHSTSSNSEYRKELDYRYPSPSRLESSFPDGSSNLSDSETSFGSYGEKHYLSAEAQGMSHYISAKKPQVEVEAELSDSASSLSFGFIDMKEIMTIFSIVDDLNSSNWELEYVRDILCNTELVLEDCALREAHKIIPSDLFDELENQKTGSDKMMEAFSKPDRKVLFDSVNECLGLRCERLSGGNCKEWAKWAMLFQRKECLAKEVYRDISGWTSMGDLMVDELVDKDMSTQYGKWVDFEIEAFEEGVEIENGIITSLVDELVADLLF